MRESIVKPVDVKGSNGLWGTFNTQYPELTSSSAGYLLVMAPEKIGRLDDFDEKAEGAFWDFTFAKAAEGVNNRINRGLKPHRHHTTTHSVMCAINDGVSAWQTVGTLHAHVIWTKKPLGDIRERLITARTEYTDSTSAYRPYASHEIDLSKPNYVSDIRHARKLLRTHFLDATMTSPEDIGFSLYTQASYAEDPRNNGRMVVELWTRDHHAVASLSGFARCWNGLTKTPISPNKMGLNVGVFRPEIGGPV